MLYALIGFCTGLPVYILARRLCAEENGEIPALNFKSIACTLSAALLCGILWLLCALCYKESSILIKVSAMLICTVLVLISVCDLVSMTIPTSTLITLSLLAVIYTAFDVLQSSEPIRSFIVHVFGGVFSFILFFGIYLAAKLLSKREEMGNGDLKLVFPLGLVLGSFGGLFIMALAAVSACIALMPMWIIGKLKGKKLSKDTALPFAPFISFAGALWLLFGNGITAYYFSLFDMLFGLY